MDELETSVLIGENMKTKPRCAHTETLKVRSETLKRRYYDQQRKLKLLRSQVAGDISMDNSSDHTYFLSRQYDTLKGLWANGRAEIKMLKAQINLLKAEANERL